MAKKKRTSLPRVTVFAMNKRDLVAFVQAVETLRLLVDDLRILTAAAKSRKKPAVSPAIAQAAAAAAAIRPTPANGEGKS